MGDREPIYVEGLLEDHLDLARDTGTVLHLFQREVTLRRQRGEPVASEEYGERIQEFLASVPHPEVTDDDPDEPGTGETQARADPSLRWANFSIGETLKEDGKMGWVVLAQDLEMDRTVVLKVLPATAGSAQASMLEQEPFLMARRSHPHIVQVFGVGTHPDNGRLFFSMEHLEAGSLENLANRAGLTDEPSRAVALLLPLAHTLTECHGRGLTHNDVKPSNILLDAAGNAKLADFGLAGLADAGVAGGTRCYSAPEKARRFPPVVTGTGADASTDAGAIDLRKADVYSLGLVLYELLTGKAAVDETNYEEMRRRPGWSPAPPRRLNPRVSRDLEAVCLRALHPDPAERYTAETLAGQLGRVLAGEETDARRWSMAERCWAWVRRNPWWTLLLVVLAVLAPALVFVNAARDEAVRLSEGMRRLVYWGGLRDAARSGSEWDPAGARQHLERAGAVPAGRSDLRDVEYHLLSGSLELHHRAFREGAGAVTALACSPDGKLLAAGYTTGQVLVWDVDAGRLLHRTTISAGELVQLSFQPDGAALVVAVHSPLGGPDPAATIPGRVLAWDLAADRTQQVLDQCPLLVQHDPTGKPVFVLGLRREGRLVGVEVRQGDGRRLGRWDGPATWSVGPVALSRDRRLLGLVGLAGQPEVQGAGQRLLVVELATRRVLLDQPVLAADIVDFDPVGRSLVWSAGERTHHLSLEPGARWGGATSGRHLGFSADGKHQVTTDQPGWATRVPFETGPARQMIEQIVRLATASLAGGPVLPAGLALFGRQGGGSSRGESALESTPLLGHAGGYRVALVHPGGEFVCTGGEDGVVKVWRFGGPQSVETRWVRHDAGKDAPLGVALSPSGNRIATLTVDGHLRLWDYPFRRSVPPVATGASSLLGFDPTGEFLALGALGDWVDIRAVGDPGVSPATARVRCPGELATCVAFAPASGEVALGLEEVGLEAAGPAPAEPAKARGRIVLHDRATGASRTLHRGPGEVSALAFHPDGQHLVLAAVEVKPDALVSHLRVLEVSSGRVTDLGTSAGRVGVLRFDPQGRRLISGSVGVGGLGQRSPEGELQVWDWAARSRTTTQRHSGGVFGLTLGGDGSRVVTSGHEPGHLARAGGITFWEPTASPERLDLPQATQVLDVAFLREHGRLIALSPEGYVTVLDCRPQSVR